MRLIDSHCHLEFESFQHDRPEVFRRIGEQLELAIQVASDIPSNQQVLHYCQEYEFIYGALGLHPHDSKEFNPDFKNFLAQSIGHAKIVAVGEIGLDYFKQHSSPEIQKRVFRELLGFAKENHKPVVIHCREAFADTMAILKEERMERVLFHCFSGNWQEAQEVLRAGFMISLSGTVTYPKNYAGQEVAQKIPLECLMLETDSPFLSPQPYRGKRNEPVYVVETAKSIASQKGLSLAQISEITSRNVLKFFGIPSRH